MSLLLGSIADDFTGATDLAAVLTHEGMRAVVFVGVPPEGSQPPPADAAVVALKSRTAPAQDAVRDSLAALRWLQKQGARQFFFKYCSTFDSTDSGNIGPVADALLDALESDFTVVCPAFPENRRTVYKGHLFVGDVPLSESSMRDHPLTPMRDSDLVRVLGRQTAHRVGLAPYESVAAGSRALGERLEALHQEGCRYAVVDALSHAHLSTIGEACRGMPLVTGGSGVARGLPRNFRLEGRDRGRTRPLAMPELGGYAAVLAGSCSAATLRQIAEMRKTCPGLALDIPSLSRDFDVALEEIIRWADEHRSSGPVLVYSSAAPEEVRSYQQKYGPDIAHKIEQVLACVARRLVDSGFDKLVIAGGETSGAVVRALKAQALAVGPEIAPGVPWTQVLPHGNLALALKSGNFGGPDFFTRAFEVLAFAG